MELNAQVRKSFDNFKDNIKYIPNRMYEIVIQISNRVSTDHADWKEETNYYLILIKKFLDGIDWAHNFVQYVKQEFDELLYRQ